MAFVRYDDKGSELVAVINFTPVTRENYEIGIPDSGVWDVVLNSDSVRYGGNGVTRKHVYHTRAKAMHGFDNSVSLTLPGLSALYLKKR